MLSKPDRNIPCAFLISLSAHLLVLIPLCGAVSLGSYSKHAAACTLSMGSIRILACEAPMPSNEAASKPQNGQTEAPVETEKPPADKRPESDQSRPRVPKIDVKNAAKSTGMEKSPSPTSKKSAPASSSSRGDSGRTIATSGWGKEDYFSAIRRKIAEAKRYPAEAANEGSQGTAVVGFELHRNGAISNVRVLKSSLSGILDLEAQKTVQRASPFPAVPAGIRGEPLNIRIPLSFEIVKR